MDVATGSRARSVPPDRTLIEANSSDLAHEMTNWIQVVNGNLELIAARTTDEGLLGYIANARTAAQQLTQLSERLRAGDA